MHGNLHVYILCVSSTVGNYTILAEKGEIYPRDAQRDKLKQRGEKKFAGDAVSQCGLQKNLADSYRKVGHAGNMSDVAWQASSHNLVETSSYQRNSVVFVVRMPLKAGLPPVANLSVGYGQTFG
jgi:hypothetical protein